MPKFLNKVNLPQYASAPSSPTQGDLYYNTTDDTVYVYDGAAWLDLAAGGGGSGDITEVVAGSGLTGGATSGSATLNVGAGTGITVNADDVAIDNTVVATLSGTQTLTNKTLTGPVIDNPKLGYSTQATANSTLTLTNTSNYYQYFTGSVTGQIVVLPVASTMTLGQAFEVNNNSSASITINSSGGNLVATAIGGFTYRFICILTSGTTAASWSTEIIGANNVTGSTGSVVLSSFPTITSLALDGYLRLAPWTTTTASAGTLSLTLSTAKFMQKITGTTTHTVALPSTATIGWTYIIYNTSTGDVTVTASGGQTVATLKQNQAVQVICNLASGTTAADWDKFFLGGLTATGTGASVFATSPTLVTPDLGTPSAINLSNATSLADAALANTGTAGTYTKVTTDSKGRVSSGTTLSATDIPTLTASKISDFDTQVRTNRLDQMAAPTSSVSLNSQKITSLATPTADSDAATKAYVDATAEGLDIKASCVVATTTNITLSGLQLIDGYTTLQGDRVLVKNQTTDSENGIYVADSSTWSRASDAAQSGELTPGTFVFVERGTANENSGWVITTDGTITIGSTAIAWTQFSGAGQITAGSGLTKSSNTLNVGAGTGITVNSDDVAVNTNVVPTISGSTTVTFTASGATNLTLPTSGTVLVSGGALGTPSSGTLTNATGLPVSTGISGLGAGVATFLGTPSSANLAAAVTGETGTGALVFGTSPSITLPTVRGNLDITRVSGEEISAAIRLYDYASTNYAQITVPTDITANYSLTLPANNGSPNQLLTTDGSGVLSWSSKGAEVYYQSTQPTGGTYSSGDLWIDSDDNTTPNTNNLLIAQKTASYTLASDLSDAPDEVIEMNVSTANTVSIPTDATANYPIGTQIHVFQFGAGQTTIAAVTPGTTTVVGTPGLKLRAQYSFATLIKRAANYWIVVGDTAV